MIRAQVNNWQDVGTFKKIFPMASLQRTDDIIVSPVFALKEHEWKESHRQIPIGLIKKLEADGEPDREDDLTSLIQSTAPGSLVGKITTTTPRELLKEANGYSLHHPHGIKSIAKTITLLYSLTLYPYEPSAVEESQKKKNTEYINRMIEALLSLCENRETRFAFKMESADDVLVIFQIKAHGDKPIHIDFIQLL